jgi:hypothetical protein
VRATGEDINDPYNNNNLSGIVECLYDKYRKKTFVTFTNSLIDVMSFTMTFENTENSPWIAFEEMELTIANWKKKSLFKFMTEDQFFSAAYLKGMHAESKFRKELITETTKFIRNSIENEDNLNDSSSTSMPIFKFIKDYVKVERENRKFANKEVRSIGGPSARKPYDPSWIKNKKLSNTENAAVANTSNETGKLYSGEVMKMQKVTIEDNKGKKHVYAATKKKSSLCPKCFPDSGVITDACARKCFGEQCTKCGYYGHISYYCMQGNHADTGEKISH